MSNFKKEDDFIIKFDDMGVNNSSSSLDKNDNFNNISNINNDYIFKTDSSNIGDYFIKIDDGDIVEQEKEKNELYIMNDDTKNQLDDIPHYNSPEYAEYMSKLNKDSLKEISMESINSDSITHKIKEEANKKYSKKQIQTLLFGLIGILFVASLMTFGFMIKDSGLANNSASVTNNTPTEKEMSDLSFMLNVVSTSNKTSLEYYNELKELAVNNRSNSSLIKSKIEEISKLSKENLNEVYSLKNYIDADNYGDIIAQLKSRYDNIIDLCNTLYIKDYNEHKSIYNKHAKAEIKIIDTLNMEIIKKLDYFGIPYKVENNSIIFDN